MPAKPSGNVFNESELRNTIPNKYSFQSPRKLKMATVTRPGRASGSMTEKNVRVSDAPSSIAASRTPPGNVRKNAVSVNTVNGRLAAT